jgi:hypothetical protein
MLVQATETLICSRRPCDSCQIGRVTCEAFRNELADEVDGVLTLRTKEQLRVVAAMQPTEDLPVEVGYVIEAIRINVEGRCTSRQI